MAIIDSKNAFAFGAALPVESKFSYLLQERYFPTTPSDYFTGSKLLFDFENRDLEKGAYVSRGFSKVNSTSWFDHFCDVPRVGIEDAIDLQGSDRQLTERIAKDLGVDASRNDVLQNLIMLKAERLTHRIHKSIEELCAMVLKYGGIDFAQAKDESSSSGYDELSAHYFDEGGPVNHGLVKTAWGQSSATPYADVCAIVDYMTANGSEVEDLVLGPTAWSHLVRDEDFKLQYTAFHTRNSELFGDEIEKAAYVGTGVFNGRVLNIIVVTASYKNSEGRLVPFIDPTACILITPGIGRTACGCVTLQNESEFATADSYINGEGKVIASLYRDRKDRVDYVRAESRPLPVSRFAMSTLPWIYCDTGVANGGTADGIKFGSVPELTFKGVKESDGSYVDVVLTRKPDDFNNRLAGETINITAKSPQGSNLTFVNYVLNGKVWDGTKVPAIGGTVLCVMRDNG